jgi:hypothetical protein
MCCQRWAIPIGRGKNALPADPDKRFPSIADMRIALTAYLERIWSSRLW